jgi:hypothetical protein
MLQVLIELRSFQERFGGNAAPVDANAAKRLLVHDANLQAKLRSAKRGDVAAGAAAKYEDIKFGCGHGKEIQNRKMKTALIEKSNGLCKFAVVCFGLKPALGVNRGHATGACGGDSLTVVMIMHVACDKHTGNIRVG